MEKKLDYRDEAEVLGNGESNYSKPSAHAGEGWGLTLLGYGRTVIL